MHWFCLIGFCELKCHRQASFSFFSPSLCFSLSVSAVHIKEGFALSSVVAGPVMVSITSTTVPAQQPLLLDGRGEGVRVMVQERRKNK